MMGIGVLTAGEPKSFTKSHHTFILSVIYPKHSESECRDPYDQLEVINFSEPSFHQTLEPLHLNAIRIMLWWVEPSPNHTVYRRVHKPLLPSNLSLPFFIFKTISISFPINPILLESHTHQLLSPLSPLLHVHQLTKHQHVSSLRSSGFGLWFSRVVSACK